VCVPVVEPRRNPFPLLQQLARQLNLLHVAILKTGRSAWPHSTILTNQKDPGLSLRRLNTPPTNVGWRIEASKGFATATLSLDMKISIIPSHSTVTRGRQFPRSAAPPNRTLELTNGD
jgi:hypothetical protein